MNRVALSSSCLAAGLLTSAFVIPAGAVEEAEIYIVHGVPDVVVDVELDGEQVGDDVEVTEVAGPFDVDPEGSTLTVLDAGSGETLLEHTITAQAGSVTDVVVHLPADPGGDPMATTFDLDLAAQPTDKGSLLVAHTAAVAPADIRVNGEVLFSNVANGESLETVVPADTYSVDIVPTGEEEPVVFGPVDLPVQGGTFQAVYAVGDPSAESMTVAVHTVGVEETGSAAPDRVDTGTGGQAAAWAVLTRALDVLRGLF